MRSSFRPHVHLGDVLKLVLFIAAIASSVLVASCSDDSADNGCTPGEVQSCQCPEGQPDSTQVCNDDGASWGECDCTDPNACDGVTCQDPPDDECQTDGTLHDYNQEADGLCVDGECVYSYETVTCEWGCVVVESDDDKCFDPCEDTVCDDNADYCEGDLAWHCSAAYCEPTEDGEPECKYSWIYDDCSIYENTCIMWGDFSMCD